MITQMKIVKEAETDVNKVDTVNASCNKRPNNKINLKRLKRLQGSVRSPVLMNMYSIKRVIMKYVTGQCHRSSR